jgi:hypothetical protein
LLQFGFKVKKQITISGANATNHRRDSAGRRDCRTQEAGRDSAGAIGIRTSSPAFSRKGPAAADAFEMDQYINPASVRLFPGGMPAQRQGPQGNRLCVVVEKNSGDIYTVPAA